jgi:hypothetical protein
MFFVVAAQRKQFSDLRRKKRMQSPSLLTSSVIIGGAVLAGLFNQGSFALRRVRVGNGGAGANTADGDSAWCWALTRERWAVTPPPPNGALFRRGGIYLTETATLTAADGTLRRAFTPGRCIALPGDVIESNDDFAAQYEFPVSGDSVRLERHSLLMWDAALAADFATARSVARGRVHAVRDLLARCTLPRRGGGGDAHPAAVAAAPIATADEIDDDDGTWRRESPCIFAESHLTWASQVREEVLCAVSVLGCGGAAVAIAERRGAAPTRSYGFGALRTFDAEILVPQVAAQMRGRVNERGIY